MLALMPAMKERAKTLVELLDNAAFLFADRPIIADEAAASLMTGPAAGHLRQMRELLSAVAEWNVPTLEAAVRGFAEANQLKLGAVAQPLRAALSGRAVSPPVFDMMAVLGKEETLARIGDAIG
jgi:glutamyl-tRNA synthetase